MVRLHLIVSRAFFAVLFVALVFAGVQGPVALAASASATYDENEPQNLTAADLFAASAILIDAQSGSVLFAKDADRRMYPASTTKVMTLLLGVEYGQLDQEITVGAEAGQVPKDSSLVPINFGEKIVFQDLLYGFMLRSGNDAANTIAVTVAGSIDKFVDMMNERAGQLGLENTHFSNAHGYHDANHYTSAGDIAKIARAGMNNPLFRDIVGRAEYVMPPTNLNDARTLKTTDSLLDPSSPFFDSNAAGIKTGYTSQAGYCFVGASLKGGRGIISVVFNTTQNGRWTDTELLLNYGYTRFERHVFKEFYGKMPLSASITGYHPDDENAGVVQLDPIPGATDDFSVLCLPDELDSVIGDFASRLSVAYTRDLVAPIQKGDIMGTLSLTTDAGEVLQTTLIAGRDVASAPPQFSLVNYVPQLENINANFVKFVLIVILLFVVLVFLLHLRVRAIRRRRRREALARRRRQQMIQDRRRYYS
jgi:D-alanyl-D-alanine carboxypeptidase (penicillin-binding protein 5/6)